MLMGMLSIAAEKPPVNSPLRCLNQRDAGVAALVGGN